MEPPILENALIWYARRFPIPGGKLRVINSCWRTAIADNGSLRVATLTHGGLKMRCDLNEMLQRQFYFFGTYFVERDILKCWEIAAKDAKIVFDVGANGGIFSLAALAVQRNATVHAFEPTPEIATRLRETATLNGLHHLHVHRVAVLETSGTAALRRFRGECGTNEGMNFVTTEPGDCGNERVESVCLDQFCRDRRIEYVDLLKLDIQGQEYSALLGSERLLTAGRIGSVFTELNWVNSPGDVCTATESILLLDRAGYRFSRPGKRLTWVKAGDWLRSLSNVIARRSRGSF
jgi:FkbM family methyltransferase